MSSERRRCTPRNNTLRFIVARVTRRRQRVRARNFTHRESHIVTVTDLAPGGVRVGISGISAAGAGLSMCTSGGSEALGLLNAGTTVDVECVDTTTGAAAGSRVSASSTNGEGTVIVASGGVLVFLPPGQTVTRGSPVTAAPTNTRPIPVELVDAFDVAFGSFELNAGESVDVEVMIDAGGQLQVHIAVLDGGVDNTLDVTVFGYTHALTPADGEMTLVPDTTPPVIGEPTNVVAEAASPAGAEVSFGLPAVTDDFDPAPVVTAAPTSGTVFPLGTTPVTITATDAVGNSATAALSVTVVDTTPPTITAPADQVLEAASAAGATASFAATATDIASTPVVTYSHAPGSTFPLGTTTVTATATDGSDNTASATFAITVHDSTAPTLAAPPDLVVTCSQTTADGRGCAKTDDPAIAAWLASASASDSVDAAPTVTHDAPAVFPIGVTTVTFRAVDDGGNSAQGTARVRVVYNFGGFLPPLLRDGTASIQQGRQGRTIPVKFQLRCANGTSVSAAVATIAVFKMLDVATGAVDTTDLTADAGAANNNGVLFRYDATSQQYVYNLSTAGWSAPATYRIIVTLDDGTQHMVEFSLR